MLSVDATLDPRLDELRARMRALEEGIRTLQARLAVWDHSEPVRDDKRPRETVPMPVIAAMVEP